MSVAEAEMLLGDVSRRFDDWIVDGVYFSRLTVVRSDGVPQTFEASSASHEEARRQACVLAASALRMNSINGMYREDEDALRNDGCATDEYSSSSHPHTALDSQSAHLYSTDMSLNRTSGFQPSFSYANNAPDIPRYPMQYSDAEDFQTPSTPPFHDDSYSPTAGVPRLQQNNFPSSHVVESQDLDPIDGQLNTRCDAAQTHGNLFNSPQYSHAYPMQPGQYPPSILSVPPVSSVPLYYCNRNQGTVQTPVQGERSPATPMSVFETAFGRQPPWPQTPFQQTHGDTVWNQGFDHPAQGQVSGQLPDRGRFQRDYVHDRRSPHIRPAMCTTDESSDSFRKGGIARMDHRSSPWSGENGFGSATCCDMTPEGERTLSAEQYGRRYRTHVGQGGDSDFLGGGRFSHSPHAGLSKRPRFESDHGEELTENKQELHPVEETGGSDEDDNHLARFNELCQRGVASLCAPKYQYRHILDRVMDGYRWECIGTTTAQPPESQEFVTLSKTGRGKNKKDARRSAARLLLRELVDNGIISKELSDPRNPVVLQSSVEDETDEAMSAEVVLSVKILNELWQKARFICKPKWSVVPVSTGPAGRWRCDLLIKTKECGNIETFHVSCQKKLARQMASHNAVQILKSYNFPGLFSRTSERDTDDEEFETESGDEELGFAARNAECFNEDQVDHAVRPFDVTHSSFGSDFTLPENYTVAVAYSDADCNSWISENVKDSSSLGLYLDSYSMREALVRYANEADVDTQGEAYKSNECRVICFGTSTSALLVCAHAFEQDGKHDSSSATKNRDEVEIHAAEAENDPSDDNNRKEAGATTAVQTEDPSLHEQLPTPYPDDLQATPAQLKVSWIPSSIKALLEQENTVKYVILADEGALVLRIRHGIRCRKLYDLSVASVALKGLLARSQGGLPQPDELVHDWLRRRFSPFSPGTFDTVPHIFDLLKSSKDIVLPAVPVALATSILQQRVSETAESRRRKRYGAMHAFEELRNRLCSQPC